MWGIGRVIMKLLEEISRRPELERKFHFVLYFKDEIPDLEFLNAPIFEKRKVPVPFFKDRLFPIYYLILLPVKLWFERLDVMFWPAYMLPFLTLTKSLAMLTEDVYYEAFKGNLPFRYRFFYAVFGTYSAKFSNKLLALSETSKQNISRLYKINPERILVDYLGIDNFKNLKFKIQKLKYILFVGQAFPRRHLKETILAFENIAPEFPDLNFIAIGPDKYEVPTIDPLIKQVNANLGRKAVIHKDYVSDDELLNLYRNASAIVYVSDREAFGLPPMEALAYGVPPVIMDNQLGRELFKDYAFYVSEASPEGIAKAICFALTDISKISRIRNDGASFTNQYSWSKFADRWLDIVKSMR